ncbi:MAG: TonB-dependent receptor domain-containing protein, partial [Flavobacteriales bacterium]
MFKQKSLFGLVSVAAFLCLEIPNATSQEKIQGKILDDSTNSPIPNVHIRVNNGEKGTTSDKNGNFNLMLPKGKDSLLISHTGYHNRKIYAHKTPLNIKLNRSSKRLEGVSIISQQKGIDREFSSLSKMDAKPHDIPSTYDEVSKKKIEERGADQLTDAMNNATGIRPINRFGGFQTFRVRGFNDFVILTDGVRDERHNLSSSAPSSNLAGVDHIEVLKGPSSALYGHSALGGVMNVVRNKPTSHFTSEFKVSAGSFERKRVKAGVGGPVSKNINFRVDAGMSDKKGWRNFSQNRNHGYFALDFNISEKDELEFRSSISRDDYNTDSGLPTVNGKVPDNVSLSTRFNDPEDFTRFEQYNFQVRYTHQLNEKLKISNQFSYVYDDIENSQGEGLAYTPNRDSVYRTFYLHFNHETTPVHNRLELEYETKTGPVSHKILTGYSLGILDRSTYMGFDFNRSPNMSIHDPQTNQGHVDVSYTQVGVKDEEFHGVYIRDWITPLPDLKILLGARFDNFTGSYHTDVTKGRNVV